jgi:hypothetical protein
MIEELYGNLFDMYAQISGEHPYQTPMRIYPAAHYTMGGLWVDYDLQSTIPGARHGYWQTSAIEELTRNAQKVDVQPFETTSRGDGTENGPVVAL